MSDRITIYSDGAAHNKVGINSPMGIGIAIKINGEYREDLSLYGHYYYEDNTVRGTSVASEHIAVKEAMKYAVELKKQFSNHKFFAFCDNQNVTRQFNREYNIKDVAHQLICMEAQRYAQQVGIVEIRWIRREHNKEADILSKRGRHDNSVINKALSAAKKDGIAQ